MPPPPPFILPMLATSGRMPTPRAAYAYETKWDGYRAEARWDGQRLTLLSRQGHDLLDRFPELAGMAAGWPSGLILDGEMVVVDERGTASFGALQQRLGNVAGRTGGAGRAERLRYVIFDLLWAAGASCMDLPYEERRRRLTDLELEGPAWTTGISVPDGDALLARMRRSGQEGVIAKLRSARYEPGHRSHDWIKIKVQHSDEFLIVGWYTSGKQELSSLLLGIYDLDADGRRTLRWCGKVGTGFSSADRSALHAALSVLRQDASPCRGPQPRAAGVQWCRPLLVAQIRYSEWTRAGALRHPAFLGLRSDKAPEEVVRRSGRTADAREAP